MIYKEDYEYLKNLPYLGIKPDLFDFLKVWYASEETTIIVARIFNSQGIFRSISSVIDYFEKPRKFEQDIQALIKEYEGDMEKCPNCDFDRIMRWGKFRKCTACLCVWEVEEAPKETTKV